MGQALKILQVLVEIGEAVGEMIAEGLSDDEIRERLAKPDGVGQKLLDAARSRKKKIKDFVDNG